MVRLGFLPFEVASIHMVPISRPKFYAYYLLWSFWSVREGQAAEKKGPTDTSSNLNTAKAYRVYWLRVGVLMLYLTSFAVEDSLPKTLNPKP